MTTQNLKTRESEITALVLSSEKASMDALEAMVREVFPVIIKDGYSVSGINTLRNHKMVSKGRRADIDWLTGHFLPNELKDNGRLGKRIPNRVKSREKRLEEFCLGSKTLVAYMRDCQRQTKVEKTPEQILEQHKKTAGNALKKLITEDGMSINEVLSFAAEVLGTVGVDEKKAA